MKYLVLLLLLLSASICQAANVTPALPTDGNGNVAPSVRVGDTWQYDSGAIVSVGTVETVTSISNIVSGHITLTDTNFRLLDTYVQLRDRFGRVLEFDQIYGGSVITVDKFHHEIHEGHGAYSVSDIDTDVDSPDSAAWLFVTGSQYDMHIAFAIGASLSGYVYLYENPVVADSGAVVNEYNYNRNYADTSAAIVYKNSIVNQTDTCIWRGYIGSGVANNRIGGLTRTTIEWILHPGRRYAVVYQAANANTVVSMDAEWYEHSADNTNDF